MFKSFIIFLTFTITLIASTINLDPSFKKIYDNKANSDKLTLMIYTAVTCPQCAYMKKKVFTNNDVKPYLQKHFVILEKDINKDQLPENFEYFGIPTIFFVNNNGQQVAKIVGSSRAKPFLEKLHTIIQEQK
jgi:thioredoxin-related protein